jgi:hypothetical protein
MSTFAFVFTGDLLNHELRERVNLNSLPGIEPVINFNKQISANVFPRARIGDAEILRIINLEM